jgi:hypothetical protein
MRASTIAAAVWFAVTVTIAGTLTGLASDPPVVVVDGGGTAFNFGAKGSASSPNGGGGSGAEPAVYAPVCLTVPMIVSPDDPAWAGHTAAEGGIVQDICEGRGVLGPAYFLANVTASAVDPAVVAAEAYNSIRFPVPTPHLSPYAKIAINYWNYLSVDDPGPLSASASAAGLTVTATARLASSTWSMGEVRTLHTTAKVAAFTCRGGGARPGPDPEWNVARPASTDCAYAYQWQSLPGRTGGAGTWPVTVSTRWDITWTASNGLRGTATRTQTSAPTRVTVGEWRTVVVAGGDRVEGNGGG